MGRKVKRNGNIFRTSVAAGLSFCLAFSGMALPVTPAAEAAASSVVRIAESGPGAKKTINLGLNKAVVVDLPADAHDILVADPSLADAVTRTSRRIYLFGKAVGQTNIFVFGPNGEEIVSLEVAVERDVAGLEANLRRFIPDADINVEIISDNVVLTGTVRTPLDSTKAVDLARAFLKGGEATTRNITAQGNNGDADIFAEDRQSSQIVNLLTIEGDDQVTLKVTVAEVSRQVLKQLGFNGSVGDGESGIGFRNPANLGDAIGVGANALIKRSIGPTTIASYINAMEQAGVMRTLAEPSLTAISGQEAKFYVGGEFRLAGVQGVEEEEDEVTGETKPVVKREVNDVEYGIRLNFKPVVLGPGRISLAIETDVSEPTYEGSVVTGNGTTSIPGQTFLGIRRREASTSVELPSGGSIVIAGLVQDNIRQAMSGLPGAAKIPILGTLFRSKDFVRNETELVIIATPYLVRPVARAALSRPDDNFNPANDLESFFLGRVNRIYGRPEAPAPVGRYHGNVGFIYK
ncbi:MULTISPECIES: type II and III secretion system protein family protein [unclassified Sinorhizobium]|uniref:type II and III secretion system protein family protein n=1 Tax=unclassified Sinorhizobium TaxID=2613772 RepID=UPI0024C2AFA6|nr:MULTISPECIES: type II and III secretion system protein family protein [unclassified Sinorhizobium]MDK1377436.1 type II and III secretion system protein family protein [Sinorhizobium sp. 6-70]MDK1477677.1 type II and III secretion system protein family protein [Sinorhizobium sp. 6-117]